MEKSILERAIESQAAALREFGYPDVTAEMVKEAHDKWLSGVKADEVIGMFCERSFEEHPLLFGRPA